MKNKIAIIANGKITNKTFHKKILKNVDIIICADGGANTTYEMKILPNYIVGDFDSIKNSALKYYKKSGKTIIKKDTNQYKTDLEKAIYLAETLDPYELIILGAIGDRLDHTLANIFCLLQIKSDIKAQIIDEKNIIELIDSNLEIFGNKNDIVSVIPLTDVLGLSYNGLKWIVKEKDTKFGWFGISNTLSKKIGNIDLIKGKVLVIRVKEN